MGSEGNEGDYRAFLLRLWCERDDRGAVWRCSLEDPATRERRGFDGVEALGSFLGGLCRTAGSAVRQPVGAGPRADE